MLRLGVLIVRFALSLTCSETPAATETEPPALVEFIVTEPPAPGSNI